MVVRGMVGGRGVDVVVHDPPHRGAALDVNADRVEPHLLAALRRAHPDLHGRRRAHDTAHGEAGEREPAGGEERATCHHRYCFSAAAFCGESYQTKTGECGVATPGFPAV